MFGYYIHVYWMGWGMKGMTTHKENGKIKINVNKWIHEKNVIYVFKIVCSCNQQYVLKDVCPCNQQHST